jgi:hypothetical protein
MALLPQLPGYLRLWLFFATALVALPPVKAVEEDLLPLARQWTTSHGLPQARDLLWEALAKTDESKGFMERRLNATNADKSLIFRDSIATQSLATRKKTGIFLVLGYNQNEGRSPPIIQDAAKHLATMGFQAELIPMEARMPVQTDAAAIYRFLQNRLPLVDRAVVIGFSKGSCDLAHFWTTHAKELPTAQRNKIKLWINCAGVVRGSHVAQWAVSDNRWRASVFRAWLALKAGRWRDEHEDLFSLAPDPWQGVPNGYLSRLMPRLHCLNLVATPDGVDGYPTTDKLFRALGKTASKRYPHTGPTDGLVESAASLLPPGQAPQWIVRIRGSHALLDGRYTSGNRVAGAFGNKDAAELQSGRELLDDILRALPRSLVE